ncbi:hypothetical protein [Chromobacterium violaceum]|uniref:hypothetical protein n=1 Tax=Chromobacterium violaceum TaxID=536 RepID=UPI001125071B|nr:hypothetical protein [Chromobacterium violaceum]
MSDLLRMTDGPNVLEMAYRSLQEQPSTSLSPEQAADTYAKLFTAPTIAALHKPIERFSLTDPTIRTFTATTTDGSV